MVYDMYIHLPMQIEGLLEGFRKADVPTMERALENIRIIVDEKKFLKTLDEYQQKRLEQLNQLQNKALDAIKTIQDSKSFSELYIDIEEIKNDLIKSLELLEHDYWKNVNEYVTLYIKSLKEKEEEDTE